MSHFVVLVIGDDHEKQLEPYDENIEVEPYRKYSIKHGMHFEDPPWDLRWATNRECAERFCAEHGVSDEQLYKEGDPARDAFKVALDDYTPSFSLTDPTREDLERVAELLSDEHEKYGVDDVGLYEMSTYSPDSKWDWYQVGGRWHGFLPVKEGSSSGSLGEPSWMNEGAGVDRWSADRARKRDIDFERARNEARERAEADFGQYAEVIRHHPDTRGWDHFQALVKAEVLTIEGARELYRAQPGIVALREANEHRFLFDCLIDTFGDDRDAYVQRQVDQALVPFAILLHGRWHERSSMGWWGVTYDEKMPREEWNHHVQELFDSLDDDTWVTVVDCHI